jgi:4-amino-4-deoxy-L-arabinose transferase-like glycosyltransferase
MAANMLTVVARKSITIDEASAIPAGFYHLHGHFQLNSEHPPPPKMFAALPLVLTGAQAPPVDDLAGQYYSRRTVEAAPRFWRANRGSFSAIFFWSRVPMVVVTLGTGLLVFAFTRRLFGARASVFAVALFCFEPNLLAHGRIVKDIHVAFAYLLFFYALYLYWTDPTTRRALLLGLATGLAPVVKFSMCVVLPVFAAAAVALVVAAPRRGWTRARIAAQLGAAALVALVTVNAAYLFSHQPLTAADVQWLGETAPALAAWVLPAARAFGWLVPPYFLFGVSAVLAQDAGDHHVFLLGAYSGRGWWYYFPAAFALKTTLPFLVVTVLSLGWSAWRLLGRRRDARLLFLLAPVALYAAMAMWTSIQIGIRHLIPAFPFLAIMGGALLDRLWLAERARAAARAVVLVALFWHALEAARAYPDYIPYMNQLASGRPHWQYLSDSNVEWGDDVGALAEYLKARGETRVRAALLGGPVILPLYGVEYVDLTAPPGAVLPETNYVALGASYLNGSTVPGWSEGSGRETKELRREFFAAWRGREPEAVFGGTIYLYRVR